MKVKKVSREYLDEAVSVVRNWLDDAQQTENADLEREKKMDRIIETLCSSRLSSARL